MQNRGILPDALYRLIVETIFQETTPYRLALVSQVLRPEAERVLYHAMTKDDLAVHRAFLKAITRNPRLASYVREFSLIARSLVGKELEELLSLGLQAMTNPPSLGLKPHCGLPPTLNILLNCTFQPRFQLDSLSCECDSGGNSLIEFLGTQLRIHKLSLSLAPGSWSEDTFRDIPPTYLPNLEQLECYSGHGMLRSFLPNRKVTRVRWVPEFDEPGQPDPVVLSQINRNAKMLAFGGYCGRIQLPRIANHLQNLELLELIGLYHSDLLLDQLKHMPSLKRLVISRRWQNGNDFDHDIVRDGKSFVTQLFEEGRTLEVVDIQRVLSESEASVDRYINIWSWWGRHVDMPWPVDISQTEVYDWH